MKASTAAMIHAVGSNGREVYNVACRAISPRCVPGWAGVVPCTRIVAHRLAEWEEEAEPIPGGIDPASRPYEAPGPLWHQPRINQRNNARKLVSVSSATSSGVSPRKVYNSSADHPGNWLGAVDASSSASPVNA